MKYIAVSLFVIPTSLSMPNQPQSSLEESGYLGQNNGYFSNGEKLVRRGWSGKGWGGMGGMKDMFEMGGMKGMFGSPRRMMMMGMMGMMGMGGANPFGVL